MNKDVLDPKLKQILTQIASFGFKFYAFDEDKTPLVTGPNNQVVPINVAINFINEQVNRQKEQSAGNTGPESIPQAPQTQVIEKPQIPQNPDRITEKESNQTESKQEKQESNNAPQSTPAGFPVPQKAPEMKLKLPENKPYSYGFDPAGFNKNDLKDTIRFIESNSKKDNSSSNKWLAILFKKFLSENNIK